MKKKSTLAVVLALVLIATCAWCTSAGALVIYNPDGSIAHEINIGEKSNASVPTTEIDSIEVLPADPLPAELEAEAAITLPYDDDVTELDSMDLDVSDLPMDEAFTEADEVDESEGLAFDESIEELPDDDENYNDEYFDDDDGIPIEEVEDDIPLEDVEEITVKPAKAKTKKRAPKTADPASDVMMVAGLGLGFCITLFIVVLRRRRALQQLAEDADQTA